MFGYIRNLPSKLPWISGEGESLGTAWWVCLPQSEYKRLNQYERQQIEDAYFVLAIDVEVLPASVPIRVSAINRYRLFVNGVSVPGRAINTAITMKPWILVPSFARGRTYCPPSWSPPLPERRRSALGKSCPAVRLSLDWRQLR